jgi:hypothetical protein
MADEPELTRAQKAARTRKRKAAGKKAADTRRANPRAEPVIPVETQVVAFLPVSVDLTRRTSGRDLRFTVKTGGLMMGTLIMGRGSVQWFAANAKRPTGEWTWVGFAKLLGGK